MMAKLDDEKWGHKLFVQKSEKQKRRSSVSALNKVLWTWGTRYNAFFWYAVKLLTCNRGSVSHLPGNVYKNKYKIGNSVHF